MMQPIEFFVAGVPKPAGSKRGFVIRRKGASGNSPKDYRSVVIDANPKAADWKLEVKAVAVNAIDGEPLTCPLRLDVTFYMPRPKHHYRTGARSAELKDSAPVYHTSKPDRTKLLRGTEDALTGIVYRDDSQIVDGRLIKLYEDGRGPGCNVRISEA